MAANEPLQLAEHASVALMRVLVADDSKVIRHAVRKILKANFEVILAEAGEPAWDRLRSDPQIKVLVTDIEMPGLDGYELICRVRAADEPHLRDLPIIAITGAEDEETKQRAIACGATDFITKPIDSIQLHARVSAYVKFDETTRELTEKSDVLEKQSVTDPLTGLHSRRYFMERGEQDIAYSLRRKRDLSVIRLDIDRFKQLYQAHGDNVSDKILVWLAGIVAATARTEDTVARVSGAEFAILANSTSITDAEAMCDRLRNGVSGRPFVHQDLQIDITVSSGLASIEQDRQHDMGRLLALAEQKLAHSKSEGGNRVCARVVEGSESAVEEVVLSEPVSTDDPVHAQDGFIAEDLSIAELESLVQQEVAQNGSREPRLEEEPAVETANQPALHDVGDLLSVDRALDLLARGKGAVLEPYLDHLVRQVQPLIDFFSKKTKN